MDSKYASSHAHVADAAEVLEADVAGGGLGECGEGVASLGHRHSRADVMRHHLLAQEALRNPNNRITTDSHARTQ